MNEETIRFQNQEYLTQEAIEKINIDGIEVSCLTPPQELSRDFPVWNSRVKLPLFHGRVATIGMHLRRKPVMGNRGCQDSLVAFEFPVRDDDGRELANIVGMIGQDGLPEIEEEKDIVKKEFGVKKARLSYIYPKIDWDKSLNQIVAERLPAFLKDDCFASFLKEARQYTSDLFKKGINPTSFDTTGGLEKYIESLGTNLLRNLGNYNGNFLNNVGIALQNRTFATEWDGRAPFGLVTHVVTNPEYSESWKGANYDFSKIVLGGRVSSAADLFCTPNATMDSSTSHDTPYGDSNSLMDEALEFIHEIKPDLWLSLLKRKPRELYAGGIDQYEMSNLDPATVNPMSLLAGRAFNFGYMVPFPATGLVASDGAWTKQYRNRGVHPKLYDLVDRARLLVDPTKPINAYDELLTKNGFTVDDRLTGFIETKDNK